MNIKNLSIFFLLLYHPVPSVFGALGGNYDNPPNNLPTYSNIEKGSKVHDKSPLFTIPMINCRHRSIILLQAAGFSLAGALLYDHYTKEKKAVYGFNENMLTARGNMDRLDEFPFLINTLFEHTSKKPRKHIITLQEVPNFDPIPQYLTKKAEENNYYIFSTPYSPRLKSNSTEKLTLLVIMLDKNRFTNLQSVIWDLSDKKDARDDATLAVAATDKVTGDEWLIECVHPMPFTKSRKKICVNFKKKMDYFEQTLNRTFTKKYSTGDFNKFKDDKDCTEDFYVENIKKGMVTSCTPYYYNPYEKAIHEIYQKEATHSFFPEWADKWIGLYIIDYLSELEAKKGISVDAYDLSHFGRISSKFTKLNVEIERDYSIKGKIKFSKQITNLEKVIQALKEDTSINKSVKELFVKTLTKVKDIDLEKDLDLNDAEYKIFSALNAVQQINTWFMRPNKIDMTNISSDVVLQTHTTIPHLLIEIDALLACHDESTRKRLKRKIIFRNKLFRHMPRPSGLDWIDDNEMIEKYTLVSDHFPMITKMKEASLVDRLKNFICGQFRFLT